MGGGTLNKFAVVFLIFSTAGCAFIDQNLQVSPQVSVVETNVGHGKKVALRVVDDREEQLIGKRGASSGYGAGLAKINTDQDLAEVVKSAVLEGMRKKGFQPVGENDATVGLKVTLRTLSYDSSAGLWTQGNIGKAAVKLVASQASGKTYEKTYRGQQEIRTAFVGSQETNAKVVNGALNDMLEKVFADTELWSFLAQ